MLMQKTQSFLAGGLLRILAWGCVMILAVLSLLPAPDMPHTGLPDVINHFVAYAGSAVLAVAAHRKNRKDELMIIVALCVYAAILEYLQRFAPGRSPGIADFIASAIGAVCGGAAATGLWSVSRGMFALPKKVRREKPEPNK